MTPAVRLTKICIAATLALALLSAGTYSTHANHSGAVERKPTLVKNGSERISVLASTGKNASWNDITRIYKTVTVARAATEKYQSISVAEHDGYRLDPAATGSWDRKGVYVQYTNARLLGRPFDATAPAGLLYMRMGGLFMLSGVAYALPSTSRVAALDRVIPGSLAKWQQRLDYCRAGGKLAPTAAAQIHDHTSCSAQGGKFTAQGRWIARAWMWLPGAGLFDTKPDPMVGMNMGNAKVAPGKPMNMMQGPYQMEMMPTSGTAPTWSEILKVYTMLVGVKAANDKYRDVAVAEKKGFVTQSFLFVPGQGAHYVNPYLVFAPWNLKTPPVLVYDSVNGKEQLRSALYLMPENSTPKQLGRIFPLSMAAWHRHINNCFTAEKVLPIHDEKTCVATSGAHWAASTPWMVHAWLWDKNAGVFDMDSGG